MSTTLVRHHTVAGRRFTVNKVEDDGEEPYFQILCPDGLSFETDVAYMSPPTDKEIEEAAGIWETEQQAEPTEDGDEDEYLFYDIFGGL